MVKILSEEVSFNISLLMVKIMSEEVSFNISLLMVKILSEEVSFNTSYYWSKYCLKRWVLTLVITGQNTVFFFFR